jgi:hypothetical protein
MQLPDIIKSSRVLIKKKKEWRKGQAGEGKTENRDRDKRKGWFSRWRYGRSRCRLCWRYTRNRLHEALENELKQGLGGSGQNALEDER